MRKLNWWHWPTKVKGGVSGFTLLELVIVMFVMAILVGIIAPSINFGGEREQIEEATKRFKGVFDLASEYAMLNHLELGVIIKENNYRFVAFDGERWQDFAPERYFEASEHDEQLELELELDGLPWAEGNLLNEVTFDVAEDDEDPDREMLSPQIFILSSGDITPFRLIFMWSSLQVDGSYYYQVIGEFTAPVMLEGPIEGMP